MVIHEEESLIHWNYFLALEKDLENLSRYIEFNRNNQRTYSIEIARLLLTASAEVDTLAKEICRFVDPDQNAENIIDYQRIIPSNIPDFLNENVSIPRFNWYLDPWEQWRIGKPPVWWRSHNKVKHLRSEYFRDANLKNVVNAIAALLICEFYFHRLKFPDIGPVSLASCLSPWGSFVKLDFYELDQGVNHWFGHRIPKIERRK